MAVFAWKMTRVNLKSSSSMHNINIFWSCLETFCRSMKSPFSTRGGAKGFSFAFCCSSDEPAGGQVVILFFCFFFFEVRCIFTTNLRDGKSPFCTLSWSVNLRMHISSELNRSLKGARQEQVVRKVCPSVFWGFFLFFDQQAVVSLT